MRRFIHIILSLFLITAFSCNNIHNLSDASGRTENFDEDWKFSLNPIVSNLNGPSYDDSSWQSLNLPHDWSVEQSFTQENTGASTGFLPGGIGWYRKSFNLKEGDKNKVISVEFDGVYSNAEVSINGFFLGKRPNGYTSFSYDLTKHLKYGDDAKNILVVKVDRSKYMDSRWYTGAGIYRDVRLVIENKVHIKKWGVQITTPKATKDTVSVTIKTKTSKVPANTSIKVRVFNEGTGIAAKSISHVSESSEVIINLANPKLWSTENPNMYIAEVSLKSNDSIFDIKQVNFGIRNFRFDADKGFFLNEKPIKLKGVNLHHAAGLVGAAVPDGVWERRLKKLKTIGVNAIRTAHNPASPTFLDLCDKLGFVVVAEFFDEWNKHKDKSVSKLGANDAPKELAIGYSAEFDTWGERDLKETIKRDYNHPSIIMWSIGNEIEWTYPYYSEAYEKVNGKVKYYEHEPIYSTDTIKSAFAEVAPKIDTLGVIAKKLSKWVKEEDTTRPVTSGSVLPSVAKASGYLDAVDVTGFNYRAMEYDKAHQTYPEMKIYGSENWAAYSEWKAVVDRPYVAGIFIWTGIAYAGEAEAFPNKGLNLSLLDFAGFQTPRGHFFECLWNDNPKTHIVTIPLNKSEYRYNSYKKEFTPNFRTDWLRRWDWEKVKESWTYKPYQQILVETYTNTEEVELFLNNESLGKQKRADYTDNIIKWVVPYKEGEIKAIGYNNGLKVSTNKLKTHSKAVKIQLKANTNSIAANGTSVVHIEANLVDKNGVLCTTTDSDIKFTIQGDIETYKNLGVDNGWKDNIQNYKSDSLKTYKGKALMILQSKKKRGTIQVKATGEELNSNPITISIN